MSESLDILFKLIVIFSFGILVGMIIASFFTLLHKKTKNKKTKLRIINLEKERQKRER